MPYRLRYLAHDLELPIGEFVVGRSTECQLSLDDPLVSRRHAVLRVRRDGVSVQDFGSRNGVLVNGTKIVGERELSVGDKVGIGSQEMVLHAAEGATPNATSVGEEVYRRATQTLGAAYVMDLRNAVAELAAKDPALRPPTPAAGHRPATPAAPSPAVVANPATMGAAPPNPATMGAAPPNPATMGAAPPNPATMGAAPPNPATMGAAPPNPATMGAAPPNPAPRPEVRPPSPPTVQPGSVADPPFATGLLAGPSPSAEGSRAAQSFQLLGGVADKSLAMGKADDAERILQVLLNDVMGRARDGNTVEPNVIEPAARYAARLAGATGKAIWVDYAFELYRRQRRVLPAPVIDELYSVVRKVKNVELGGIRAYVETLREGAASFGPAERFLMQRIEGLERQMALK